MYYCHVISEVQVTKMVEQFIISAVTPTQLLI